MSLIKNSSIVIFGVIISNLLSYLFHFIAGRILGPTEYGIFGSLMALFFLIALPAGALAFAVTKFSSRYAAEGQLGKLNKFRKKIQNDVLVFAAIMLVFIIVFSQHIADYLKITSKISIIIVGLTLAFTLLLPVNKGILLGLKKFKVFTWNSIAEASSRVLLLLIFLFTGYGVEGAVFAYGLAYLIAFLLVFPFIKVVTKSFIGNEIIESRVIYKFMFLVLMANLVIQSIVNIPSLYVKHHYSSEVAGYWTAALNIARIFLFITSAISMVMFPEIAGEADTHKKRKIFANAAILVFIASSLMAILFFTIPRIFIKALYGASYLESIPFLQWMGVAMVVIGFIQLRTDYFLAKLK